MTGTYSINKLIALTVMLLAAVFLILPPGGALSFCAGAEGGESTVSAPEPSTNAAAAAAYKGKVPTVTAVPGNGRVVLSWEALPDATKYAVSMINSSGELELLSNKIAGTQYSATGLTNGENYSFVVQAYINKKWTSADKKLAVSASPYDLEFVVTAKAEDGAAVISWNEYPGAAKYAVSVAESDGTLTLLSNKITNTSYRAGGLENGREYTFCVQQYIDMQWTDPESSPKVCVTPEYFFIVPSVSVWDGEITLSWESVEGASKYAVSSVNTDGSVDLLSNRVTDTSYTVVGLTNGTEYRFIVQAYKDKIWSAMYTDKAVSGTPVSLSPDVTAIPGDGCVKLSWKADPRAQKYAVLRYAENKFTTVKSVIYGTSYTVRGCRNGVASEFLVKAYIDGKWTSNDYNRIISVTPLEGGVTDSRDIFAPFTVALSSPWLYFAVLGAGFVIYWLVPAKARKIILLLLSLVFFLLLSKWYTFGYVAVSVLSVYFAAVMIGRTKHRGKKKAVLTAALLLNFGILAFVRCLDMVCEGAAMFDPDAKMYSVIAPVAVGIYTLNLTGYLIDCYRGDIKPEKNPLRLMLFAVYFPLFACGPVMKYEKLSAQLFAEHTFDYDSAATGMRRAVWGAAKVFAAERIAALTAYMFSAFEIYSGFYMIAAGIIHLFALYLMLSGLTDISCGISLGFGIKLGENFDTPFFAGSMSQLWKRWYMSVGGWINNYITEPLTAEKTYKRRSSRKRSAAAGFLASFLAWLFVGLWFGKGLSFLVGGAVYFFAVTALGKLFDPVFVLIKEKLGIKRDNNTLKVIGAVRTYILASFGVISLGAGSLTELGNMLSHLFSAPVSDNPLPVFYSAAVEILGGGVILAFVAAVAVLHIVCDVMTYTEEPVQPMIKRQNAVIRWGMYIMLIVIVVMIGTWL